MNPGPIDLGTRIPAWVFYFSRFFIRQFYNQRGFQIASALAYATLLSLVPLLTVMFAFGAGLPVFANLSDAVQAFIFNNFVPSFGSTVQEYLGGFSANARKLTVTGLAVLVVIALMLMATIDDALNTIWRVNNRRNPVARFLLYWAMLTLGPVLVGAGLVATSYILSLPSMTGMEGSIGLGRRLLSILPFLTTAAAFCLLYQFVPNCHVRPRHALIGGVTAAVLFELAKYGFGVYVKSTSTQAIYGAIAVIPLFLVWIYTSWVIVLLGAHITFCIAEFRLQDERAGRFEDRWNFADAFKLVCALWHAQREGQALAPKNLRRLGLRLSQQHANEILDHLLRAKWVERTANGGWMLSRDLDDVTLFDLHKLIPRRLPLEGTDGEDPWLRELDRVLRGHKGVLEKNLDVPMAQLLRSSALPEK
ncbi:MAG TPA: YihY family inner membrane protein [Gammaproteobacteria bacterium]|jgi:membrane protein